MIAIRAADPHDAPGTARVILQTWRSTYRGIVPDEVLDGMDEAPMTAWWAESIGRSDVATPILAAENERGEVVGVALVDEPDEQTPERVPGYGRELRVLYVLDAYQGQGIGRRLVGAVFTANARARRFYEALGARPLRQTPLVLGRFGVSIETTNYGWHDVATLRMQIEPTT